MIEVLKQALGALIQARKLRFALWRHGCDCRDEHTCDPLQDEYAKQFNDSIIKLEQAIAELESQEQNFCSRCGKRTKDLTHIHTCTPPQD
jgi:hypothetical protein